MSVSSTALSQYRSQLRSNRLGLWLFFVSEAFLFAGLLVTCFYLWGSTRPDLDQQLGLTITSILLLSSFFMYIAEAAAEHENRKTFLFSLILTAMLGSAFLVGVVVFEWGGHIKPWDGAFGAVLYGMTGMHALHVASGIVFILIVWYNGFKDRYTADRHWGVEACAIYWHYVDVIWVFFYPAIYLIGTVPT